MGHYSEQREDDYREQIETKLRYDAMANPSTEDDVRPWGNTTLDPNVNSVINSFRTRADIGKEKYGTDTTRTDIDLLGWLTHLQEELMDATIYIERLKKEI